MINHIQYGLEWSDYFRDWKADPNDPDRSPTFDEAEARRRHDGRKQFSMLMDLDDGSRLFVISCEGRDCYFVEFLDAEDRVVLVYCFVLTPGGRLFLSQHDEHRYEGSDRMVRSGRAIRFKQDGRAIVLASTRPRRAPERELHVELDPAFHDEPVPAFGQWESLIRRRELPYALDSRN